MWKFFLFILLRYGFHRPNKPITISPQFLTNNSRNISSQLGKLGKKHEKVITCQKLPLNVSLLHDYLKRKLKTKCSISLDSNVRDLRLRIAIFCNFTISWAMLSCVRFATAIRGCSVLWKGCKKIACGCDFQWVQL